MILASTRWPTHSIFAVGKTINLASELGFLSLCLLQLVFDGREGVLQRFLLSS
jgi:hypothetical protein